MHHRKTVGEHRQRTEHGNRECDERDADCGPHRALLAGRSDHLRRWCFARRKRRGELIAAGQRRRYRERGWRALRRLALEAALDCALDRRVEVAHDRGRRDSRSRPGFVQLDQLVECVRLEHPPAGEQLEQHEAERIDVAALCDLAPGQLLRRHVRRCARADVVHVAGNRREAEIGEPDVTLAIDHHVGRLQVTVQDAAFVRSRHPRADLPGDLDRLFLREAPDAAQQRRQILAVHVLHRQKRAAAGVADVVGAADVAMGDRARDADFVVELRKARGIVNEMIGEKLERDCLSELEVVGPVDLAHAAAPQERDNAEAAGEDRTRRKASPDGGAARRERAGSEGRLAWEACQVIH